MTSATTVPPIATTALRRRASANRPRGGGQASAGWSVRLTVLAIVLLWVVPTLGVLITSLRTVDAANSSGWWTVFLHPSRVTNFTVSNYSAVISSAHLGSAFVNSAAITLPATFIPILIAAFAGYAFTFMRFPGRQTLFVVIVGLLVIPNYVAFVPILKLFGPLHLNGTFPAAWLFHIGFGMPLAIYIMRNYMSTLPRELVESAKVDGAGHFTTFWRLIMPMSVPALASFAIFQFLWVWNDLLVALIFVGPGSKQPLTIAVTNLLGQLGTGWELVTAGGLFSMVVPVVVFLSLQRYFVRGLTAGAVKG